MHRARHGVVSEGANLNISVNAMVELTDEQYGALMTAITCIANGRKKVPHKHPRLIRTEMIEIARRACIACDLSWSDADVRDERDA